eukprot:jgi/Chlat1/1061/Chrsp110S01538
MGWRAVATCLATWACMYLAWTILPPPSSSSSRFKAASENDDGVQGNVLAFGLWWFAPFFSGSGYGSEAVSFISALPQRKELPRVRISQHGDALNFEYWHGLPTQTQQILSRHVEVQLKAKDSIIICHSEPGAWDPAMFETSRCPPAGMHGSPFVIGRTMFETDSALHIDRLNRMDAVWVPTDFHLRTFVNAGVHASKLVKVVEPVETDLFNPNNVWPMSLPVGSLVIGDPIDSEKGPHTTHTFSFLSVFKWEERKGWDVLLHAFLKEFSSQDNAALYILTTAYHSDDQFVKEVKDFVSALHLNTRMPSVYLIKEHVPGMTEYMTEANSYPLASDRLVKIKSGPFMGQRWAEPSIAHLRELMRRVYAHRVEARSKGVIARQDMVTKYSPSVVADKVIDQLLSAQERIRGQVVQSRTREGRHAHSLGDL